MNGKRTLQPEGSKVEKWDNGEELTLEQQNKELEQKIKNLELKEKYEAKRAKFKTAEEYSEALSSVRLAEEQNQVKEVELTERERLVVPMEQEVVKLRRDAERRIAYAEVLKPLGENRDKIKSLLIEIRDKIKELVELPDAVEKFNKYNVEAEHDKLYVEVMGLIENYNGLVKKLKDKLND